MEKEEHIKYGLDSTSQMENIARRTKRVQGERDAGKRRKVEGDKERNREEEMTAT